MNVWDILPGMVLVYSDQAVVKLLMYFMMGYVTVVLLCIPFMVKRGLAWIREPSKPKRPKVHKLYKPTKKRTRRVQVAFPLGKVSARVRPR